jgi:hypothetical protein
VRTAQRGWALDRFGETAIADASITQLTEVPRHAIFNDGQLDKQNMFSENGAEKNMKSVALNLAVGCLIFWSAVSLAQEDFRSGPQPGEMVPGPAQALNVAGPWTGRFHCPVCENGLNAQVLVFARQIEGTDKPVTMLLQGLDPLVDRNLDVHLGVAAIVLYDGGYKELLQNKIDGQARVTELPLTRAITSKEETAARLAALAKEAKLNHVEISLGPANGPAGYQINPDADVTVLAYFKDKVILNRAFKKDELTPTKVPEVVNAVGAVLANIERPAANAR